jgi:hypothetical protein
VRPAADIQSTMSAAAQPQTSTKAPGLLVEHVNRLGVVELDRPPAHDRLEQAIGRELTARLLYALAGDHGIRVRVP